MTSARCTAGGAIEPLVILLAGYTQTHDDWRRVWREASVYALCALCKYPDPRAAVEIYFPSSIVDTILNAREGCAGDVTFTISSEIDTPRIRWCSAYRKEIHKAIAGHMLSQPEEHAAAESGCRRAKLKYIQTLEEQMIGGIFISVLNKAPLLQREMNFLAGAEGRGSEIEGMCAKSLNKHVRPCFHAWHWHESSIWHKSQQESFKCVTDCQLCSLFMHA
jgi:hypothetical protein